MWQIHGNPVDFGLFRWPERPRRSYNGQGPQLGALGSPTHRFWSLRAVGIGSATLSAKSANMVPRSHARTSLARNTPYIITNYRWDTHSTVGGTPDGQNTVMLKLQPFQVRSCPASFRRSGSTSCIAVSDCLSSTPFGLGTHKDHRRDSQ